MRQAGLVVARVLSLARVLRSMRLGPARARKLQGEGKGKGSREFGPHGTVCGASCMHCICLSSCGVALRVCVQSVGVLK